MSLKYRNSSGVETPISGLNGTSGELVPSATYVQSGNLTCKVPAVGAYSTFNVTFTTPMPDTDYEVNLTHMFICDYFYKNKTVNGFAIIAQNAWSENAGQNDTVYWTAYKLTTNEDRELDEQAIADLQTDKQNKTLETPIIIDEVLQTTVENALSELKVKKYVASVSNPSDLNDAVGSTDRDYCATYYTYNSSASNKPTSGGGQLIAYKQGNFLQQISISKRNYDETPEVWIRVASKNNTQDPWVFGSWQKLVTESDITPTQIASYTKAGGGAFNLKVYKSGGMKYINITGDSTAQTLTNGELYTLTDAAVPTIAVTFPCYYVQVGVASKVGFIFIGTNGKVQLRDTDYEVVNANVTYIRGQGWYY